jgi:hypothetical protein
MKLLKIFLILLIPILAVNSIFGINWLIEQPTAWWPLVSNANDASGNAFHADATNVIFTGSESIYNGGSFVSTNQNFDIKTVSFMFKIETDAPASVSIMGQRFDTTEEQNNWALNFLDSGNYEAEMIFWQPTFGFIQSTSDGYNDSDWHHGVIVTGVDGLKLYIDNILEGSSAYTGIFGASPNDDDFSIGRVGNNGVWNYFTGSLKNIVVFENISLNSSQVTSLFNNSGSPIIDTTPPQINVTILNNLTEPIEINTFEFTLFDFVNVTVTDNESGVDFTKYFYEGEEIPEILVTSFKDRPISNISNYTGISFDIGAQEGSPRGMFFKDSFWYLVGEQSDTIFKYYENFTYTGTSFDVGAQDNRPFDLFFKDGFWHLVGARDDTIFKYYENFTYTGTSFDVSAQDTFPISLTFKDGFWYLVGSSNDNIYQYYENFTYTGTSFDVGAQDLAPRGLFFKDSFWYLVGGVNAEIFKYYENFTYTGNSFDVGVQDNEPRDLFFKEQSLYLLGDDTNSVFLYNTTIFNQTIFEFNHVGNNNITIFAQDNAGNNATQNITIFVNIYENFLNIIEDFNNLSLEINTYEFLLFDFINLSNITSDPNFDFIKYFYKGEEIPEIFLTPIEDRPILGIKNYSGVSFDISSEDALPKSLFFNGEFWYVSGDVNNAVFKYEVGGIYTGTSFDISTEDIAPRGIFLKDDFWYLAGAQTDNIYQYYENWTYTGTSFDISSEDLNPTAIFFNDGFWYLSGNSNDEIFQYYENWTYTGTSFDISLQDATPVGMVFQDGFWYLAGAQNDNIYQYYENWTYTGTSFDISTEDTIPAGIAFRDKFFGVAGDLTGQIYRYNTIFNETIFRFDEFGNQNVTIFAQDIQGNNISSDISLFVDPFQYFRFTDNLTNQILNFTFFDIFFEEEAQIKLSDLGFGSKTLIFEKQGFNDTNFTIEFTNTSEYNLTIQIPFSKIILQIFDRDTDALLASPPDSEITMIGPVGFEGSTSTGIIEIIDALFISGDYQIIVEHSGYRTESIFFEFTNQQIINLEISLIPETNPFIGTITYALKDQESNSLEGAICQALEWNPTQDAFTLVSEARTNDQGRCTMNIELETKSYQFFFIFEDLSLLTQSEIILIDGEVRTKVLIDERLETLAFNEKFLISLNETDINNYTSRINFFSSNTLGETHISCINRYKIIRGIRTQINSTCNTGTTNDFSITYQTNNTYDLEIEALIIDESNSIPIGSFFHESITGIENLLKKYNYNKVIALFLIVFGVSVGGFGFFKDNEILVSSGVIIVCVSTWFIYFVFPSLYSGGFAASMTMICSFMLYGVFVRK